MKGKSKPARDTASYPLGQPGSDLQTLTSIGGNKEKLEPFPASPVGVQSNSTAALESNLAVPQEVKLIDLPYDAAISPPGIYPEELKGIF